MSVFLGIGLGPIQTGIFIPGARRAGFDRIVIAEVDKNICSAVRKSSGMISINIAESNKVRVETIEGIEIYNPSDPSDLKALVSTARDADEINTALPSVAFYKHISPWLKDGFNLDPDRRRIIYTSENNNHAAELLDKELGCEFRNTSFANTVIGKMSSVVNADECKSRNLAMLTDTAGKGHLVEAFNKIYISSFPGVEKRRIKDLIPVKDLYPFEEAKLYGHNAIHFLLGLRALEKKLTYMHEISKYPEITAYALSAFTDECGKALCRKWKNFDNLFTEAGFKEYAEDLICRMTNPFLMDKVERICRDLDRKMGWDDRLVGTARVCLAQDVFPEKILESAKFAARELYGVDPDKIKAGLALLWKDAGDSTEKDRILELLTKC